MPASVQYILSLTYLRPVTEKVEICENEWEDISYFQPEKYSCPFVSDNPEILARIAIDMAAMGELGGYGNKPWWEMRGEDVLSYALNFCSLQGHQKGYSMPTNQLWENTLCDLMPEAAAKVRGRSHLR